MKLKLPFKGVNLTLKYHFHIFSLLAVHSRSLLYLSQKCSSCPIEYKTLKFRLAYQDVFVLQKQNIPVADDDDDDDDDDDEEAEDMEGMF